jgi:hypothetical protein
MELLTIADPIIPVYPPADPIKLDIPLAATPNPIAALELNPPEFEIFDGSVDKFLAYSDVVCIKSVY